MAFNFVQVPSNVSPEEDNVWSLAPSGAPANEEQWQAMLQHQQQERENAVAAERARYEKEAALRRAEKSARQWQERAETAEERLDKVGPLAAAASTTCEEILSRLASAKSLANLSDLSRMAFEVRTTMMSIEAMANGNAEIPDAAARHTPGAGRQGGSPKFERSNRLGGLQAGSRKAGGGPPSSTINISPPRAERKAPSAGRRAVATPPPVTLPKPTAPRPSALPRPPPNAASTAPARERPASKGTAPKSNAAAAPAGAAPFNPYAPPQPSWAGQEALQALQQQQQLYSAGGGFAQQQQQQQQPGAYVFDPYSSYQAATAPWWWQSANTTPWHAQQAALAAMALQSQMQAAAAAAQPR